MTKQDLVDQLSTGIGLPRPEILAVVDGFLAVIMDTVAAGERVELRRFGVWKPVVRKARHLKTPDGTHEVDVPRHSSVVFIPAAEFRARMNDLLCEAKKHQE
jgi:nucleoid DNA-binding protein